MTNSPSLILTSLDKDVMKNTLKAYLQSQDRFADMDFEGSNLNVLLDLLSLNTFHNSFYLNMLGAEAFMDSAQLRDSVVSHAKDLNYTPRSFKSATAKVNMSIVSNDINKRSILIPKGTTFTSNFAVKNYTFSTNENIIINNFSIDNNLITFTGTDIVLHEGYFVADSFVYKSQDLQRFVLTNKNIDTSSISITVVEDIGANILTYSKTSSLFGLDETSKVFFVQGAENDCYEIVFGDGVTGRKPKDNSTIIVEYRISNGELPNGCKTFIPDSTIDGELNITLLTVSAASGGSVSETVESIKYNAPRHFTTQERAVTAEDYENLLKAEFPEVNAVTAFGGEDLNPPQFGKVFVSVDLNEVDGLPEIKKDQYYRFLKPRSPVSIDPVFVSPEYMYIGINSDVNYNINASQLTTNDIQTIVSSAISTYASANLNNFNRTFRYSKLIQAIDNSQLAIVSNETSFTLIKTINPALITPLTFNVAYKVELDTTRALSNEGFTFHSSEFILNGTRVLLKDDNLGNVNVVSAKNNQTVSRVGTINYMTGLIQFARFIVDSYPTPEIKLYATAKHKDISTVNNVILNILAEDVVINVNVVRI